MQQCLGCLGIVFGKSSRRNNRRKYLVKYNDDDDAERNSGLEFENLFADNDERMNYGSSYNFVTKEEKDLISQKQYDKIIEQQKLVDDQIRQQTYEEEEKIKYEEERFDEAHKEATRAAVAAVKLKEATISTLNNTGKKFIHNCILQICCY